MNPILVCLAPLNPRSVRSLNSLVELMRFSERIGVRQVRSLLQGRSLDAETRNRLWSAFARSVPQAIASNLALNRTWMKILFDHIWSDFFKEPVDDMPRHEFQIREAIKEVFLGGQWYEVYDFIEFAINSKEHNQGHRFAEDVTRILAEELAGFRLLNGQFIEITDETEIAGIEEGLRATSTDRFEPARAHLGSALQLLSDRRAPDYRNSIKESISAVESTVQILTGDQQAELGRALKLLRTGAPIHGALRSALLSLYGYTSDADGIRHALTEEPNLDAADAKFMLVTCSAFVVYLIQKAASAS